MLSIAWLGSSAVLPLEMVEVCELKVFVEPFDSPTAQTVMVGQSIAVAADAETNVDVPVPSSRSNIRT